MQELVIKVAVGVVPELVVRGHDRLVVAHDLQRCRAQLTLQELHRITQKLIERFAVVVDVNPNEPAHVHLGFHLAETDVFFGQTVLETLLLAGDLDAIALGVERPEVEDAGEPFGVSGTARTRSRFRGAGTGYKKREFSCPCRERPGVPFRPYAGSAGNRRPRSPRSHDRQLPRLSRRSFPAHPRRSTGRCRPGDRRK